MMYFVHDGGHRATWFELENRQVTTFQIGPSMTLEDFEDSLKNLPMVSGNTVQLHAAVDADPEILADIWSAIFCGSLCRLAGTEVIVADCPSVGNASAHFSRTLAGLTCASMAVSIKSQGGEVLDVAALKRRLMLGNEGLVTPDSDVSQVLVEFDTDYSVSSILQRDDGTEADARLRRRLFERQVLRFRQLLDLGALRRGGGPVDDGPAGAVGQFLAELHENGFEHGARQGKNGLEGTRFLRVRTHNAADPADLLDRCGPFKPLRNYVTKTFCGSDPATLIEASISDFGLGIVDGFQASPAGMGPDVDRRALLDELIYGRLTSKSDDPSAGLGIQKALEAAERMQAFVSLRTAEFWMAVSFLSGKPKARLTHLKGIEPHPKVAGTHWQIFWPHY